MVDEKILALLGHDRVADYYGMRVEEAGEGRATVSLELGERHLNGIGIAQGGVVFALADVAFAMACNSRGPAVAASATISFCAARGSGILRATAREASVSRKLGTYEVTVVDGEGATVAVFQGLAYRKTER